MNIKVIAGITLSMYSLVLPAASHTGKTVNAGLDKELEEYCASIPLGTSPSEPTEVHRVPQQNTKTNTTLDKEIEDYLESCSSTSSSTDSRPTSKHETEERACTPETQTLFEYDLNELLMGEKNVCVCPYLRPPIIAAYAKKFNRLLQEHKIHCLSAVATVRPNFHTTHYILYIPAGRTNALLLLKHLLRIPEPHHQNHYLIGSLLNDSHHTRSEFYRTNHDQRIRKSFERHRQQTEPWIKRNRPTIEQWIQDNAKEYTIIDRLGLR